ncbi:hypothetical protein RHGRI_014849 [Rhododendron griersonianum]|uniref:Conserved oligomeric Golgi complex subunit 4 N-terminal domain-containing protein n=1 Tax=Rhododendron griersonianum TaxID=479676 RepID=A0AAV6KBE9_9ERIC|nr:hypothetical protein RHGRI_014849 [Rhododendron griersonianum]
MSSTPIGSMEEEEGEEETRNALKFGSPEALEYVRKLTDVRAMTRLLHECIAYQRALDVDLENILSHRSDLDKQLSNLEKSADVLEIVSGKVRELDLAQSRVNDTLLRIDAIVDRANCLDGVKKALDSEDFESAANYVQTFPQIDAKYNKDSDDHREQLLASKKHLEGIVRKRLSAAVDQLGSMEEEEGDEETRNALKFGSPEALEYVRKLTDVGAMTRLLHECIAYQRALDVDLENILSHRSDLDKQLSNLQKSADVLEIVKADSDYMLSNVRSTWDLDDQVSGKVRELDLA